MTKTLVLFDVDGTLVDTGGAGRAGLLRSFRDVFGVPDIEARAAEVGLDGKTDPTIIAEIALAAGLAHDAIEARYAEFQRTYVAALRHELAREDRADKRRVLPGVRTLLDALHPRPGTWLGLVTGNIEDGARAKLATFDLNRFFPDGGFSSDHPDRVEIARIAHERLCRRAAVRFAPERVAVVGDTELDVACARANGFRAVAVASGRVDRERLAAAGADAVLSDLSDLDEVMRALALSS
jgi:phosphoglycolate phosphatase-like HAD superfamily hydrolase